jgi:hypothetical protein
VATTSTPASVHTTVGHQRHDTCTVLVARFPTNANATATTTTVTGDGLHRRTEPLADTAFIITQKPWSAAAPPSLRGRREDPSQAVGPDGFHDVRRRDDLARSVEEQLHQARQPLVPPPVERLVVVAAFAVILGVGLRLLAPQAAEVLVPVDVLDLAVRRAGSSPQRADQSGRKIHFDRAADLQGGKCDGPPHQCGCSPVSWHG